MLGAALGFLLPWQFVPLALSFLVLAATAWPQGLLPVSAPRGRGDPGRLRSDFLRLCLVLRLRAQRLGELTGGIWIPLLLLFVLRDRGPGTGMWRRALDGSAAPLAL